MITIVNNSYCVFGAFFMMLTLLEFSFQSEPLFIYLSVNMRTVNIDMVPSKAASTILYGYMLYFFQLINCMICLLIAIFGFIIKNNNSYSTTQLQARFMIIGLITFDIIIIINYFVCVTYLTRTFTLYYAGDQNIVVE